jgi:hypothetical protein
VNFNVVMLNVTNFVETSVMIVDQNVKENVIVWMLNNVRIIVEWHAAYLHVIKGVIY